jgi:RNA polymerase sigma factor for flagellar operon FliA
MSRTLSIELAGLSREELQIIELRYRDGLSIADIARATSQEPKALYRRLRRLLDDLRAKLERHGLSRSEVLEVLGRDDVEILRRAT